MLFTYFSCSETRDKALKECERLREHLLAVEETSTREAIAAEERETELRKRIRILEQKTEESADSVIESANAYEVVLCFLVCVRSCFHYCSSSLCCSYSFIVYETHEGIFLLLGQF